MARLRESGLVEALRSRVFDDRIPLFGICLGMQLLADFGDEGAVDGLGWIPGRVTRLPTAETPELRVPHMGWNRCQTTKTHPLFAGVPDDARFYFVHSFRFECASADDELGVTTYGSHFTSAVARDNIVGVQFHPEKSHAHGMKLIDNFLNL
jgi:glutamine amidotransferase